MATKTSKAYIPAHIRKAVEARFDCCVACGMWDADNVGHIVAEVHGGEMSVDNMIRLCGACNRAQGTATVVIGTYATRTESPSIIIPRRKAWKKYCAAAKDVKVKAYVAK